MRKKIIFVIALVSCSLIWAQEGEGETPVSSDGLTRNFSAPRKDKKEKPPITDYKIISIKSDTTYVDTTLTLLKDYKFNYLRRDDFELLPINNVGQTYNSLAKREERDHILPLFGARARHFNFMEADDINYYHVPTPLTELYFKTTFEQGQQLDAFFTVNTSPRLNLSIAYKGVRSLGKYQHALTSTGNFRSTLSYHTKNNRYQIRTHFVSQDLLNEENGGLSSEGIDQYLARGEFLGEEDEFADRGSITVNFENAESILLGKRWYLNHQYNIIRKTDSSSTALAVGHILDITDKSFQFDQTTPATDNLLGEAYESGALSDKVALEDFSNQVFLDFSNKWLGHLRILGGSSNYNYGYNTILTQVDSEGAETNITNRLKGDVYSVGGEYENYYKGFELFADGKTIVSGDFDGYYANAGAGYQLNDKYSLQGKISVNSVAPNYNFLLYQSDYVNYNWQNDFDNVETQKLQINLKAKNIANIEASYATISNYTYFAKNADSITVPLQASENIDVLKVKLTNSFKYWKIGLVNTVMYQNVQGGDQIYNVPEIITRNSLYYEDHWFKKKALFLQAGVTFKYFSSYNGDAYDPVLSEFYVQNDEEIGGFPQIDLFFNAKVRQTRVYFKVENFGEAFSQNNEFSAPGYAYRDAVIRFGLVWNFFL
ncbi:putative porin [Aquimarina sp. D1M17]|uniref:putative porin n=1 Tax=Aquimarina acroporae TaxID=2937283 RepID=UPI0020BF1E8B|nr:putative porin [Aquimarina acroporae]MCK8521581.1 putative porin [Aquimarina acroporae]